MVIPDEVLISLEIMVAENRNKDNIIRSLIKKYLITLKYHNNMFIDFSIVSIWGEVFVGSNLVMPINQRKKNSG